MNQYAFKFQHPNAVHYIWILLPAPLACLLPVIFLMEPSLPAILAATFVPIIIGCYFLFKKGKAADTISLDGTGFTSAFFGRVDFSEIVRASGSSFFMDPPSMRIRLKDGRKLTWRITIKGSIYNAVADAETFIRFTEDLSARMDAWHARNPVPGKTALAPSPVIGGETPAAQLREVAKRARKPALFIPIGAAFAMLALVKTCGKDWFKRDEINFTRMAVQQEEKYNRNLEAAKAVMAGYIKGEGGYYLYTNDTAARAELLPKIEASNPTGSAAFRHTEANRELEAFIAHPDSFLIQTVIVAGDGSVAAMRESILNMGDSAGAKLFIRFYDPRQRIEPRALRGEATDSTTWPVFDVLTAIPLYDTLQLKDPIAEAVPGMRMMLAQVRHRPSFRLYLTGRAKDGISEALFRKAVKELGRQLAEVKADTSGFVIRAYHH